MHKYNTDPISDLVADHHQALAYKACLEKFATPDTEWVVMNPMERALRLLEEAIELAQAAEVPKLLAEKLVGHVYAKQPGEPAQKVAGVVNTLFAYAQSIDVSAARVGLDELYTITAADKRHYADRWKLKRDAGVTTFHVLRGRIEGRVQDAVEAI